MYLQFGSEVPAAIDASGGSLSLFGRTIPLEEHGAMRINYSGGNERFTAFSFGQVLSRDVPSLQGRIIFVGVLATASDIRSSPQGSTYGMVIQASALDTLLRADFLRRTGGFVTLVITMAFVLLSAVVVPRWRPAYSLLLVIALGGAYIAAGIILFDSGWIVDMVHPPAALLLTTLVGLSYTVVSARAAQRDMQELFGRYLSPQVAHALIERADRGQLHLGGELREVSVLFGDIRGFTPLTARTPPQELVAMLNQHFAVIISRIMENGGIVNKFAGDAVMALWNAPEDQPEHALSACRAALQAQSDLGALSDVVKWGFGISTGVALAGNVGSGRRLEYTVIGDSVNLAARLCGVAPAGEVWISEETYGRVETTLPAEALPPQPIKGFDAPVAAYRLKMGAEPAPAPASVEGG
jgi:adenylate cyclase